MWHLSYVCSDVTSLICILWYDICHYVCSDVTSILCMFRCYSTSLIYILWCYISHVQMLHLSYVCSDVTYLLCICDVTSLMFRCYICHVYVQMLHTQWHLNWAGLCMCVCVCSLPTSVGMSTSTVVHVDLIHELPSHQLMCWTCIKLNINSLLVRNIQLDLCCLLLVLILLEVGQD